MIREMSSFILLRKPFHAEGWTYPWVKALLSEIRQREGALGQEADSVREQAKEAALNLLRSEDLID